ncbi:28641_t:CDS:2 [Gigaspora margarita]|uniref:28641_t:CDS:1 n=1 Tax=Gigaspora margarita TaxID=4874 RepID=A0ABM8W4G9_GIGMA|nr:28641_t:CDS:2 [Gigaspora margarita]
MESSIKELTKAVMNLKENRPPNAPKMLRMQSRRAYFSKLSYQNSSTTIQQRQDEPRNDRSENLKVKGINVCYFEINDITKSEGDEYLMIKAEGGVPLFDIRNLGKRRRVEDEHEMLSWAQKASIVPKAWLNLSEEEDNYDDETDMEDIMTMQRVDVDKIDLFTKSKCTDNQLANIIEKANNSNLIVVNKIEPIYSCDLEEKNYVSQVIYWLCDDERDDVQ